MKKDEKTKGILIIIVSVLMICFLIFGNVYFYIEEGSSYIDAYTIVGSIVVIGMMIMGIVFQIKEFREDGRKEKESEYERINRRQKIIMKRKKIIDNHLEKRTDMKSDIYCFYIHNTTIVCIFLYLLVSLGLFSLLYQYFEVSFLYYCIVILIVGAVLYCFFLIYSIKHNPFTDINEFIQMNSYDIEGVEMDYLNGVPFPATSGFLNIGAEYCVYAGNLKKSSFVLKNREILGVEKLISELNGDGKNLPEKMEQTNLVFYMLNGEISIRVDDIGADMILGYLKNINIRTGYRDIRNKETL